MSDQDQRFQHRWNFRRTENDVDSSSDDDHSRPNSASEPKLMKHKLVTCQFSEENAQQTMVSPTSLPREEKENHLSFEEPNRKPNQSGKARERKSRSRIKRTTSNHEPSNAALIDLRGYMESLVEEIKIAREDLLVWMSNEMTLSSSKDDIISSKPSGPRKGQRQNAKRSKTPRNNPNKGRRKSGTIIQNQSNEEAVPPKEGKNVVIDAKPVEKTEKQKGKTSRLSTKKRKIDAPEAAEQTDKTIAAAADQTDKTIAAAAEQTAKTIAAAAVQTNKTIAAAAEQTDKTIVAAAVQTNMTIAAAAEQTYKTIASAADDHVTLSTALPQKQVINSERNPLEDGNGIDAVKRNALNSGVNLSSHHLNFDPRAQQKDVVFPQNGLRNLSDYGQNTCPTMGNGNVNGFPFPFFPQGSNCGIGMPNISSQFGQQYLTQGNRMSGVFREPPLFVNGNHAYMESYGALNQPLKFNVQQRGVMALQCPDIRRGSFNQGNMMNQ